MSTEHERRQGMDKENQRPDPLSDDEREAGRTAWLVLAVWLIILFAFALS